MRFSTIQIYWGLLTLGQVLLTSHRTECHRSHAGHHHFEIKKERNWCWDLSRDNNETNIVYIYFHSWSAVFLLYFYRNDSLGVGIVLRSRGPWIASLLDLLTAMKAVKTLLTPDWTLRSTTFFFPPASSCPPGSLTSISRERITVRAANLWTVSLQRQNTDLQNYNTHTNYFF